MLTLKILLQSKCCNGCCKRGKLLKDHCRGNEGLLQSIFSQSAGGGGGNPNSCSIRAFLNYILRSLFRDISHAKSHLSCHLAQTTWVPRPSPFFHHAKFCSQVRPVFTLTKYVSLKIFDFFFTKSGSCPCHDMMTRKRTGGLVWIVDTPKRMTAFMNIT